MTKLYNKDGILEKIEYVEIRKGKNVLLYLPGEKINGLSKMQFQTIIGKELGSGTYTYSAKIESSIQNEVAKIRGIDPDQKKQDAKVDDNKSDNIILNKILDLEKKLSNNSMHHPDHIELIKQSYSIQIDFLKEKIQDLKGQIKDYELEIAKGQVEIDKLYKVIEDLKGSGGGMNDLFKQLIQMSMKKTSGNANAIASVPDASGSGSGSIPNEFINELALVDWDKVPADEKNNYINVFRNLKEILPQK